MKVAFVFLTLFLIATCRAGLWSSFKRKLGLESNPSKKCNNPRIKDTYRNVIIEAHLEKFKNPDSIKIDDIDDCDFEKCDTSQLLGLSTDNCDYRVKQYIDYDTPFDVWVDNERPFVEVLNEWQISDRNLNFHQNDDSEGPGHLYTICKKLSTLSVINVRTQIWDVDGLSTNDLVGNFNCHYAPKQEPAASEREARWENVKCCSAQTSHCNDDTYSLDIKVRAYYSTVGCDEKIPSTKH